MHLTHKIRVYPTKVQITALKKACGVARFTWNHILGELERAYKAGYRYNIYQLSRDFNIYKHELFSWISESPKDCTAAPLLEVWGAYKKFFKKQSGFPKFKKRGEKDSFYNSADRTKFIGEDYIRIAVIGKLKLSESPRFSGKLSSCTVSRDVDQWFVSVDYELPDPTAKITNGKKVGVDLGLNKFATLSDGTVFENPKHYKKLDQKLKKEQRSFSKKKLGSKNRIKQGNKVSKVYRKIRRQKQDFLHKVTSTLAKTKQEVVIEDLKVGNLMKNHKLARPIANVGWGEFRRQLEYKCKVYGSTLTVVDKFFPSSKLCSSCGFKLLKLLLSVRSWTCPKCGVLHDRDLNAAINLKHQSVGWVTPEIKPVENPLAGARVSELSYDLVKQEADIKALFEGCEEVLCNNRDHGMRKIWVVIDPNQKKLFQEKYS